MLSRSASPLSPTNEFHLSAPPSPSSPPTQYGTQRGGGGTTSKNRFELKEDEHYEKFLGLVKGRPRGVPLLTVSNHCSPLDDPGVLVGMLPSSVTVRPELMRWTICAQEICFKWTSAGIGFGSAKVRLCV